MTSAERQLEDELISKLRDLKYEHRPEIRDRATLEKNFREKFQALNHVKLTDGEFQRLLDEIVTPDVFTAAHSKWDNFLNVISKAKTACELSGHAVGDHFADVGKMVDLGSGSQREISDLMLTRYACYLIAQNGDPAKQEIAFAQTYFAIQTRRAELIAQRLLEAERVSARRKLSDTEKELSSIIYEQTGGNQNFALIRSKGDQALFGRSTQAMKSQWRVPESRDLQAVIGSRLFLVLLNQRLGRP